MKKTIAVLACLVCALLLFTACSEKLGEEFLTMYDNIKLEKYVTLADLTLLKTEQGGTDVSEEDIDAQIDSALSIYAVHNEITGRAVQAGDTVNIDYAGTLDGVAFSGGTATGAELLIGSGRFIDGFEDGLIGAKIGETRVLELAFPDPYPNNPDMAGEVVEFTVTVNSICVETIPLLTDELAAQLSETGAETVAEYREEVRAYLASYYEYLAENNTVNTVWDYVMENSVVKKLPEARVQQVVDDMYLSYETQAEEAGAEFADYILSNLNMDEETFASEVRTYAEDVVGEEVVMFALMEHYGTVLGEDEYAVRAQEYAEAYSMELADFEQTYGKSVIEKQLMFDMLTEKLIATAEENA